MLDGRIVFVMSRYFFHLEGGERIADMRGHELPDDDAARREAERIAVALRRRHRRHAWHVIVTDELGRQIPSSVGGDG
jgi:hypothetical protein